MGEALAQLQDRNTRQGAELAAARVQEAVQHDARVALEQQVADQVDALREAHAQPPAQQGKAGDA